MYHRTIFLIVTIFAILSSCTSEEKFSTYKLRLLNNSNSVITISSPNRLDSAEVVELATVMPGDFYDCVYNSDSFLSFTGCVSDNESIRNFFQDVVIKFTNGTGYVCSSNNQSNLCFSDNRRFISFDIDAYERIESNILQLTITQQDFDNAFDLP